MRITEQAAREIAAAGELSDKIDRLLEESGLSWGVMSVALATAIAGAVHASSDNPGKRRRIINDTHALARQLLVDLNAQSFSDDVKGKMVDIITEASSRAWAGNRERQSEIVDRMLAAAGGEARIDVAAAAETILANLVCDRASSLESAERGLQAVLGDLRRVAIERFSSGLHAASDAQGTA